MNRAYERDQDDDYLWRGIDAPRSSPYRTKPFSSSVKWVIAQYEAIREDREFVSWTAPQTEENA